MTCSLCSGSGVIHPPHQSSSCPCVCEQGAIRRKILNRAALNGYAPPHCNGTEAGGVAAYGNMGNNQPPVKSTLPSLRPVYRKYHTEWAFAAGFVFCALLVILYKIATLP